MKKTNNKTIMNPILLILTSAGLGALIGLEREMRMQETGKHDYFGGVRTFAMLGVLGAISMMISVNFAFLVGGMSFLLIAIGYGVSSLKEKKHGLTTDLSGFATFLIGILVAQEKLVIAIAISILFTGILALRQNLHQIAKNFEQMELFAILKFMIISAIILPLLPNQYLDKWEIFNPYHVWLMVIFVALIRFVAFFLGKIVGNKKSIVFTGLIGGLASSTAVTSTLSEESKKNEMNILPFVAGILFANMLMFFRVILEVAVVYPVMTSALFLPLAGMGIVAGILGLIALFYKKKNLNVKKEPEISQPFALFEALKFGLFFVFVLASAKLIPQFLGEIGLFTTAAVSGLADTDAITLTVANLVKVGDIPIRTGVATIVLAVMVNTIVKIAIIAIFGSKKLFRISLIAFLLIFVTGSILLFFM